MSACLASFLNKYFKNETLKNKLNKVQQEALSLFLYLIKAVLQFKNLHKFWQHIINKNNVHKNNFFLNVQNF